MPFFELKKQLSESVATFLNHPDIRADSLLGEFSAPPNPAMGHVALPCFRLAKALGRPAGKVAQELAAHYSGPGIVKGTAAGPYANFRWDVRKLYQDVMTRIAAEGESYGRDTTGKGRTIVLEYCSPNIAKKLAFQHIRSTLIGNTLANVYEALGFHAERINFVGDWGTQFARLLAAVELWGDRTLLKTDDVPRAMTHLFELYVRFHKEVEANPQLLERASKCLQLLESHDVRSTELWQLIRNISVKSMEATLKRMHIRFDRVEGESHYVATMDKTLKEVKERANAKLSDGAYIVEVPGQTTPALVQKRDGTTLYLTRDIAAAIDRYQRFGFEKSYYVVSEQQKLHFQLLFGVLKIMGESWADRCEHVSFGTVLFGAEKMSTREGRVIFLDDILDEAKKLALAEVEAKNPNLVHKDEVAEAVGIGAIIFGELSAHRLRDLEFDWKHILALDGETGPYVQYAAVRCQSLLEKAEAKGESNDTPDSDGYEFAPEEEALIVALAKFRATLHQVTRENEPYHLTYYLIDVAKSFNRFYYRFPVLQATDAIPRSIRLALVRGTYRALANGLTLLGIDCPKEM